MTESINAEDIKHRVEQGLLGTPYACSKLEKLSGGSVNYVYRGTLVTPLPDGAKTIVLKHTEGYIASSPDWKLSQARGHLENEILTACQELTPTVESGVIIETPKIYPFNPELNTQIYSDLALSTDLKTYALTHPLTQAECTRVGFALGKWLKNFHTWGAAPEQASLREKIKENTEMRALKYQINYPTMIATIANFPELLEDSREIFEDIAKDMKGKLDASEGDLIHGDFWTGNVVLANTPFPSPDTPLKLYICDWELCCLAIPAFDLGQMCAELYELKHFKDLDAGISLITSFVEGYGPVDIDVAFQVVIFVGNHLICWGTRVEGWGTAEQIEDVVVVGRDLVVKGWEKDIEFFRRSPWAGWFP